MALTSLSADEQQRSNNAAADNPFNKIVQQHSNMSEADKQRIGGQFQNVYGAAALHEKQLNGSPTYGDLTPAQQQDIQRYQGLGAAAAQRAAYQQNFGTFNKGMYQAGQARVSQGDALSLQQQAAYGNAPSQAEILGRQMADQGIQSQMAMAASARGGSLAQAAAMRNAQQGQAAYMQQAQNQMAALRAQEMAHARDAYTGAAGAMRGQDYQGAALGLQQTGLQTQNEQFQRDLNQRGQLAYEGMAQNVNTSQLAADSATHQAAVQQEIAKQQADAQKTAATIGAVATVGAGLATGPVGGAIANRVVSGAYNGGGGPVPAAPATYSQQSAGSPDDLFPQANPDPQAQADHDYMVSDERAKEAAWDQGHRAAIQDMYRLNRMSPDEIKARANNEDASNEARSIAQAVADLKANGYDEGAGREPQMGARHMSRYARGVGQNATAGIHTYEKPRAAPPEPVIDNRPALAALPPKPEMAPQMAPNIVPAEWGGQSPRPMPVAPPAPAPTLGQRVAALGRKAGDKFDGMADGMADYLGRLYEPSDERAKDVHSGTTNLAAAARSMSGQPYAYKPGFTPAGQEQGEVNVGPMAQRMAADPVARTAVKQDPQSGLLMLDKDKSLKVTMATVAALQKQIDQLKKGVR